MKRKLEELAAFGAQPLFKDPVHVSRPNIGDRDALVQRMNDALDRRWLTNDGPLVRELETRLASFMQVEHCIAMCNATVAMEVLGHALALSGEVIVPAFTFVATAHAFSWIGLRPVFCDVEPAFHTLDAADVARAMTKNVSAVVGVHLWGNVCDDSALRTAAQGRPLLFDAAHALGCGVGARKVGSFGDAEIFSFHATKFFNTFEGGAITTSDDALARELRLMRNFGFTGYDAVATIGTNAKLNEVSAAMGLTSLDAMPELLQINEQRWTEYQSELAGLKGLRMVRPHAGATSNHQYAGIEVHETAGITRDQLLALLWSENVRARRYFFPGCHRLPPYADGNARALPVTERLVNQVLVLPAGGSVSNDDVAAIVDVIRTALENADAVSAKLPASLPPGVLPA
jgi:dTDP-4-amino-4,6-dideoxygalactose transaminase